MARKTNKNLNEAITKIKVKLVVAYPFFAQLLFHLPLEENNDIDTLATDGKRILYNAEFASKLKQDELAFILVHETLHVALGHLWRRNSRDSLIWNIATDFVINNIINDECCGKKDSLCPVAFPMENGKKVGLFEPKYKGWSAEKVYKDLMDQVNNSESNSGSSKKSNGGQSGTNDSGDAEEIVDTLKKMKELFDQAIGSHDMWDKMSEKEKQEASKDWAVKVAAAATAAKMAGKMPASIEAQLEKLLKPQKDWKQLLHEFVETENYDFSWNPPDRRFSDSDFFMPDFNDTIEKVKDLYFFIDASGSMSNEDITKCASEIQGAIYQFKNHLHGKVAYFDTQVYDYYDIDDIGGDITKTRPTGRGGTEFAAVFKDVEKQEDVAGIIILSDGYCDFPPESAANGIPVLWIFTTPDMTAPYGFYTTLE